MNRLIDIINTNSNLKLLTLSLVLIIISVVLKSFLLKRLEKNKDLNALEKSKLKKNLKTYINLLLIILLLVLWFSQIHSIFVSLLAIAAAIVLATKELIMSLTGGILVKMNKHFKVGDRIEVKGIRGFVIEKALTVTKVLEIGPEKNSQQTTGDIITIPNSVMLSESVKNESYFKGYSMKTFTFHLPPGKDFNTFEKEVIEWAYEICNDYLDEAKGIIQKFCNKEGLLIPAIDPRIKVKLSEEKSDVSLILKMPVKNQEIGDIEQKLYRKYIDSLK